MFRSIKRILAVASAFLASTIFISWLALVPSAVEEEQKPDCESEQSLPVIKFNLR